MTDPHNMEVWLENHTTFYAIAYQHHEEVERLVHERDQRSLKTQADADFNAEINGHIERAAMVVVVFSALALEAFINHYGITKFSGGFYTEHLDKLSTPSKWLIVPRLLLGKELTRNGQAYQLLREVFRRRHKLVHYKTRAKRIHDLQEQEDWVTEDHARNAIQAVRKAVEGLHSLDPAVGIDWLQEAESGRII
jgi:hypothetical protein